MRRNRELRVQGLREAIVAYLRKHPDASDTPKGIVKWWLPSMGMEASITLVEDILKQLAANGTLKCVRLPDGGMLYSAGVEIGPAGN